MFLTSQVQYLRSPPAKLHWPQPEQQVQVVLPSDLARPGVCLQLPASQPQVSRTAGLLSQVRREHQQQEVQHGPLHLLAAQEEEDEISEQTRRQVHGEPPVTLSVLWQYQVRGGGAGGWKHFYQFLLLRTFREPPSFSHKSLSCMGEDAGLISRENEALVNSPSHNRKSLHGIKKSFSLKQKKSFTGPLYIDIDSQENI